MEHDTLFNVLNKILAGPKNAQGRKWIKVTDYGPFDDASLLAMCSALKSDPSITLLRLSNMDLSDNDIASISEALTLNGTLEELDLSYNTLGVKGMTKISDAISTHPKLRILDLTGCKIGGAAAVILADGIAKAPSLKSVTLKRTDINGSGWRRLADVSLRRSNISITSNDGFERALKSGRRRQEFRQHLGDVMTQVQRVLTGSPKEPRGRK